MEGEDDAGTKKAMTLGEASEAVQEVTFRITGNEPFSWMA